MFPFASASMHRTADDDTFNFDKLKLVEKPDSQLNSPGLPQTLEDCEGFLTKLPLVAPNVDKNPKTIADMVNVMTQPDAQEIFVKAQANVDEGTDVPVGSGLPSRVYNVSSSPEMKEQLRLAKKHTCHIPAPGVFGHVVQPGCISFYNKDGKTYAVSEGRWWLASAKAKWIARNVAVNQDIIQFPPDKSKVLILRVCPGQVALSRDQGVEILLDVGTHVFNSGTVSYIDTKEYAKSQYFSHGRYHYLRVPRGKFAKVWAEVRGRDGVKSLVPRLLTQGEHYVDNYLFQFNGLVSIGHVNLFAL